MNKNIDIYYFSGTGNTLHIAKELQRELIREKYSTELFPLEQTDPANIDVDHIVGIGFPIAIHTSYPFVLEFIERIPFKSDTEVFVFTTLAGTKSGMKNFISSLRTKKKPFKLIGFAEFQMPTNFFPKELNSTKNALLIKKALQHVTRFVQSLIERTEINLEGDLISKIYNPMSRTKFMWKMVRKGYQLDIDHDECIKCMHCISLCPTENISFNNQTDHIQYGDRCVVCMRCISLCPTHAIYRRGKRGEYILYKNESISELIKPISSDRNLIPN